MDWRLIIPEMPFDVVGQWRTKPSDAEVVRRIKQVVGRWDCHVAGGRAHLTYRRRVRHEWDWAGYP